MSTFPKHYRPEHILDVQDEPDDSEDDDEAPETPTDEPSPIPIEDPPADDTVPPPMTV